VCSIINYLLAQYSIVKVLYRRLNGVPVSRPTYEVVRDSATAPTHPSPARSRTGVCVQGVRKDRG
jgi:hypothetical protein